MKEESRHREWQELNPIFIMGGQRTGTSIIWKALRIADFLGFNEGHLWFDLVQPFASFQDANYRRWLRQDIFTLGSSRNLLLERRFALMIDAFHRDLLPPELVRWVDKSPGVYAVRVAPMLSKLFPQAQFIYMKRNPITTVNSTINYISREQDLGAFRITCSNWVHVMQTWRKVRHLLAGRYVEVEQEQIAASPGKVGEKLASFLGVPGIAEDFAHIFQSQRENTAFPQREPGDYIYPVDWTDEQRAILVDLCSQEMQIWGYPVDFEDPMGINPTQAATQVHEEPLDMGSYYGWLAQAAADERVARCEQLLDQIRNGRVMRLLTHVDNFLRWLRLR